MNRLKILLANKHTTGAAIVYFLCAVGRIWMPEYTEKFKHTGELAMTYGLLLAGDSKPSVTTEPEKKETK